MGVQALHLAATGGHLHVLRVLVLQNGLPVNGLDRFERTPLQEAIRCGHLDCAKFLQANGGCAVDRKCGFSLCAAAATGDLERLQELHSCMTGLDLGTADYDGRTALHLAAAEGELEVARWLLSQPTARAAINAIDCMQQTPLDTAECAARGVAEGQCTPLLDSSSGNGSIGKDSSGDSDSGNGSRGSSSALALFRLIRATGGCRQVDLAMNRVTGAPVRTAATAQARHLDHAGTL